MCTQPGVPQPQAPNRPRIRYGHRRQYPCPKCPRRPRSKTSHERPTVSIDGRNIGAGISRGLWRRPKTNFLQVNYGRCRYLGASKDGCRIPRPSHHAIAHTHAIPSPRFRIPEKHGDQEHKCSVVGDLAESPVIAAAGAVEANCPTMGPESL